MVTLGIDPGFRACGVAVQGTAVGGTWTWSSQAPRAEAWAELVGRWARLVERCRPSVVGVERVEWRGPRRGALDLAHLAGALAGVALALGARVVWVRPVVVKQRAARCPGRSAHERDAWALAAYAAGEEGQAWER